MQLVLMSSSHTKGGLSGRGTKEGLSGRGTKEGSSGTSVLHLKDAAPLQEQS